MADKCNERLRKVWAREAGNAKKKQAKSKCVKVTKLVKGPGKGKCQKCPAKKETTLKNIKTQTGIWRESTTTTEESGSDAEDSGQKLPLQGLFYWFGDMPLCCQKVGGIGHEFKRTEENRKSNDNKNAKPIAINDDNCNHNNNNNNNNKATTSRNGNKRKSNIKDSDNDVCSVLKRSAHKSKICLKHGWVDGEDGLVCLGPPTAITHGDGGENGKTYIFKTHAAVDETQQGTVESVSKKTDLDSKHRLDKTEVFDNIHQGGLGFLAPPCEKAYHLYILCLAVIGFVVWVYTSISRLLIDQEDRKS